MMSKVLKKSARKASSDPAQESLRQHKDAWNHEVSNFISALIAFKRGLNGRGDPKLGIPPGSIKDPLPSSVGSQLNNLASIYDKIINEASQIIQEQEHYSQNRKKPKKEMMADDGLFAEASWWGSRLWAELPFGSLRKEKKENRALRLSLIKFAVSINKELKELESDLVSTKPDSIPDSVTTLAQLYTDYSVLFIGPLENYLKNRGVVNQEEVTPKEDVEEPSPSSESELELDSITSPIEAEKPKNIDKNYLEKFLIVKNDLQAIGPVLSYLEKKIDVDDNLKKTLKSKFRKLESKVAELAVYGNTPEQKSSDMELAAQEIWNLYQELMSSVSSILGTSDSFKSYLSKLFNIDKVAGDSSLTKWVNTLKLKINPTNEDLIKLKAVNEIKKCSKNINNLLDVLENYESSMSELVNKVNDLNKSLSELSKYVWTLGERYMSSFRKMKKDKTFGRSVDRPDLTKVKNLQELTEKYSNLKI